MDAAHRGRAVANAAPRRRCFAVLKTIGNFDGQFTEAVATKWHTALGRMLACDGHHQRPRAWFGRQWAAAAREILETGAAVGDKPRDPAPHRGATQLFLSRQGAAAQSGCAAQNDASPAHQTLRGGAGS